MTYLVHTATGSVIPAGLQDRLPSVYVTFISTDVSTSAATPTRKGQEWWDAENATLVCPVIPVNRDPEWWTLQSNWAQASHASNQQTKPQVREGDIENFLEEVYSLARLDDTESATDRIFDYIDGLLCAGAFDVCNEILLRVEVEKLPTTLMRSFLTITAAAKDKLGSRSEMRRRIELRMVHLKGEEITRRIIGSLA